MGQPPQNAGTMAPPQNAGMVAQVSAGEAWVLGMRLLVANKREGAIERETAFTASSREGVFPTRRVWTQMFIHVVLAFAA